MATLTCPNCAAEVMPDDLICFTCGANLPRAPREDDYPAPTTVMQEYLRPDSRPGAISPTVLPELGLPPPQAISVPANTLVVADTFGFHARGPSARPTSRVEIWAIGRRNPFLPWTGLDPWSIAALGLRKPIFYWKSVDLLESVGLGHQRWRARGSLSAFDPA